MTIEQLVAKAKADHASDIHLIYGLPPKYRKDGQLEDMDDKPLSANDCVAYARELAGTPEAYDVYLETGELDAAETYAGNRCRIHIFRQQGKPSVALRLLSDRIPKLDTLGLPPAALKLPELHKGIVLVTGETGSGKSTIIKLLQKELTPTHGKIIVNGRDIAKITRKQIPRYRRNIGVVFQNFRLLKDRTVFENVAFAQQVLEKPMKEIRREVPAMLTMVGLADQYKQYPKELSGGEQQRVALARAIVNQPDIVLADEPTGNLDPQNSLEIMQLLEEINRRGTTVVVVTHNKDIVELMQKRVIRLKKGKVVSDVEKGGYKDED